VIYSHKQTTFQSIIVRRVWIISICSLFLAIGIVLYLSNHQTGETPSAAAAAVRITNSYQYVSPETLAQLSAIEAREQQMDETIWAPEILAQECGRTFELLWDSINSATNKLDIVAQFDFGELLLPKWKEPQKLVHQIQLFEASETTTGLNSSAWKHLISQFQNLGWRLEQIEFRQNRFDTNSAGHAKQSQFYFSAHLINTNLTERASIEGNLLVDWAAKSQADLLTPIRRIDGTRLTIKTRKGDPPFQPILNEEIPPPENSSLIDPLIVSDLDQDGFPEILLVARNLLYRRQDDGTYRSEKLCRFPIPYIWTALLADFDGDGFVDLLCDKYEGLYLFKGSPQGRFDQRATLVAEPAVQNSQVMTCGDIDGDGDLDVFLAQYEEPYANGTTPAPFYEANDGNPSYLLLNDGHGFFKDATSSVLEKKRRRRSYSASFADLDADGDLDLLVVSDFAGLDLYENDGKGHFTDVTTKWVSQSHAFGMAHALADFNRDAQIDLLMIGMTSPAVNRLEHLNSWRPGTLEDRTMRSRMTFGNRLYLGTSQTPRFQQTALSDSIAHSGWSWGCAAFDFDNDSFPDLYIANGLESNQSVRDYEAEYWLHDRYAANQTNRAAAELYFKSKFSRTRSRDYSYGGYEKNRFYINQSGTNFLEAGYLFGVALEEDCRNVIAEDLDSDGRIDLLVTTREIWPKHRQTLRVYKNLLNDTGNWIGFRFPAERNSKSTIGTAVKISSGGFAAIQQIVTGDSFRSQHSAIVHFGIGAIQDIQKVEIKWPNRSEMTTNAVVNQYYQIKPPKGSPLGGD
jgi:hypothetical protein